MLAEPREPRVTDRDALADMVSFFMRPQRLAGFVEPKTMITRPSGTFCRCQELHGASLVDQPPPRGERRGEQKRASGRSNAGLDIVFNPGESTQASVTVSEGSLVTPNDVTGLELPFLAVWDRPGQLVVVALHALRVNRTPHVHSLVEERNIDLALLLHRLRRLTNKPLSAGAPTEQARDPEGGLAG